MSRAVERPSTVQRLLTMAGVPACRKPEGRPRYSSGDWFVSEMPVSQAERVTSLAELRSRSLMISARVSESPSVR